MTNEAPAGGAPAPAAIVPRWEWRTFGEDFGAEVEARLAALVPDRVHESDEVYLLSLRSDASVKVRDDLMDVKQLQQVSPEGLEQWLPVLKAEFPLPAGSVEVVAATLGVPVPPLAREAYTLHELVEDVVAPNAELKAVPVQKRRERHTLGGCSAEITEIHTDEGTARTIAVESEDAARVLAAVVELGLGGRTNTCVARGLKALTGFGPSRFAVIDVGTNSVKFHVGERLADGSWRTVADRSEITRLGEGLGEAGTLGEEPIARTVEAVAAMVDEARRDGVAELAAVGTAGLRIASNSAVFVDAVRARCGVEVEVIPGAEEARLAYVAVKQALGLGTDDAAVVVFDTGGGSSQFTFGRGNEIEEQFSVDVGAVRFTERFALDGPVGEDALAEARAAIARDLARLDERPPPDALVGIGGAVTNLAAVSHELVVYDADVVRGTRLDRAEIDRQIELYRTRTADERRRIPGLQPKRAEIILAGACIVRTVLEKLGQESLTVSDRGLRHGLLLERFGRRAG